MSRRGYNSDTLWKLYNIGGSDLALRYVELASSPPVEERKERQFEFINLHFYEGGATAPEESQRQYGQRFAKSNTRYIYFQLQMRNPWRHVAWKYRFLAQFYKPDGSLMGQFEDSLEVKPEREVFNYTCGWGWQAVGHWPLGVYRLQITVDGKYSTTGEFTIFEEPVEKPAEPRLPSLFDQAFRNGEGLLQRRVLDFPPLAKGKKGKDTMHNKTTEGLGFEGWLNKLSQQSLGNATEEKVDLTQPLDDLAKLRWFMAIDQRYLWTLPRTAPGLVTEKVVQELEAIGADYEKLLNAGPPPSLYFTTEAVRGKIADVHNAVAQAYSSLRNYPLARQRYATAAQIYTAIGKVAEAQRCRDQLARLKFDQAGNVDDEIQRLRTLIATLPVETVAHADALIELAGIYSNNGDDYEAKDLLLQAERTLDKHSGDPSGKDLADALTQSLQAIMQGQHKGGPTPIEEKMQVNGLYRQLYMALARIYEMSDLQAAACYRAKAAQRDSQSHNDEFSKRMLKSLHDDLGKV